MDGIPAVSVFISYAREDTGSVLYLKGTLERAGAKVWLDQTNLSYQDPDWEKTIRKAIANVQVLIYIGSKEARKSDNVKAEIRVAQAGGIPIIRFWLRGSKWMDSAPFAVSEGNHINGTRERFRYGVEQLLHELGLEAPGPGSASRQSILLSTSGHTSGAAAGGQRLPSPKRLAGEQIETALLDIQVLQTQGRTSEAINACEELREKSVPRADIHYYLGRLYQEAERWWDATTQYFVSVYDPQFAIFSCYGLGQCYRSLGDMERAVKYFGEALAQINLELLEETNADLLLQICYEAAFAHRDHGDHAAAAEIFAGLLRYLESRGWTRQIKTANGRRDDVLRKRLPHILLPGSERNSRLLVGKLPQLPVNAAGFFAGNGPAWPTWLVAQDTDNLSEASHGGVWRIPPEAQLQMQGTVPSVPSEPEHMDTETRPIETVKGRLAPMPDAQGKDRRQAPTPAQELPVAEMPAQDATPDLLDQVISGILGPQGNFVANLDDMPLPLRTRVTQGARAVDLSVASGKLEDACDECIEVIKAAPDYLDFYVALAEIYVRQGNIEQATQQYITFAERCLDGGRSDGAIAIYQRILQLNPQNPQNLSYRNKLSALLAQEARGERSGSAQTPPPAEPAAEPSAFSAPPGIEQAQKPSPAPLSMPEAGPQAGLHAGAADARSTPPSVSASGAGELAADALIEPDALPLWIFDTQVETREAIDAMRQIRERVSSGKLGAAGQIQELAQLAQRFRANTQLENAICVLREIARLTPNDPAVYSELAYLHIRRGQYVTGSIELEMVAALYVDRNALAEAAQVYQRMATIAWAERKHEDALRLQLKAIGYAADDVMLRQTIVHYYLEIEHKAEAIEQQKIIARTYLARGKSREAVAELQRLIALDKMDVGAYEMLGQAYLVALEYEQAEDAYRTLQCVAPSNSVARVRLEELAALRAGASDRNSPKRTLEDEPS
jgi:tetratricopeptide (TPR) repeat protein